MYYNYNLMFNMTYYKPLIIYYDTITGRIYTYAVNMVNYELNNRYEFILNYHKEPLGNRILYSIHFKSSPTLTLEDLDNFNEGEVLSITDVQNMVIYPTAHRRPMLQELYNSGFNGFSIN